MTVDAHRVLHADLAGFTGAQFHELASRVLVDEAQVLQTFGEAVRVTSPSESAAMKTAMLLRHAVDCEASWPSVRAGLHRGEDSLAATQRVAAAVAAHARPGQILCTRTVVRALRATEFVFRPLGEEALESGAEPLPVFELVDGAPSTFVEVDPVCHMRIDPLKTPHHLPFQSRTFFFCSRGCARTFAARPAAFGLQA